KGGAIMLGEKVGEMTGKTTGRRVIPNTHGGVNMELSAEGAGKVYGIDFVDFGTYEATMQEGGFLKGAGQGISMTKDGEGVTWNATGIGRFTGKGGVNWRGSVYYSTKSEKLAKLNGHAFIYEYDVDESGNFTGRVFEWK